MTSLHSNFPAEHPKTLKDALHHVENILGKVDEKNTRHVVVQINNETEHQPEQDKPPILIKSRGEFTFGCPYISADSLAFDAIENVQKQIYEDPHSPAPILAMDQHRFMAARFQLRPGNIPKESWQFDMIITAHSIPKYTGSSYIKGSLEWVESGLFFEGIAMDYSYGNKGKLIPVIALGELLLEHSKEQVILRDKWSLFGRLRSPSNLSIPAPDFSKPIGKACTWLTGKACRK